MAQLYRVRKPALAKVPGTSIQVPSGHPSGDRPPTLAEIIDRWGVGSAEGRDRATRDILAKWEKWSKEDLALLRKATRDSDIEISSRATRVLSRIETRRKLGTSIVARFPDLDRILVDRDSRGLQVLVEGQVLEWLRLSVSDDELATMIGSLLEDPWAVMESMRWSNIARIADKKREASLDRFRWPTGLPGHMDGDNLYGPGSPFNRFAIKLLKNEDPLVRARTLAHLGDSRAKALVLHVVPLLRDRDAQCRLIAIKALKVLGAVDHLGDLRDLLVRETDENILKTVIQALGHLGGAGVADAIVPFVDSPSRKVAGEAIRTLVEIGSRKHAPLMVELLTRPDLKQSTMLHAVLEKWPIDWFESMAVLLLESPDPKARAIGISILAAGRRYQPRILGMLKDPDEDVVASAVRELPWGRDLDILTLRPLINHPSQKVRASVAFEISRNPRPEFGGDLLPYLDRMYSIYQEAALRTLADPRWKAHAPRVAGILRSAKGWDLPKLAIRCLGRMQAFRYESLVRTYADKPRLGTACKEALAAMKAGEESKKSSGIWPRYLKLLSDEDPKVRDEATDRLSYSYTPQYLEQALSLFSHAYSDGRRAGLKIADFHPMPEWRDHVKRLLEDPDPEVRDLATRVWGHYDPKSLVYGLSRSLRSGSKTDKLDALRQICNTGIQDLEGNVLSLVTTPDPEVRASVVNTLARAGSREAIPALVKRLGDPYPEVRREASMGLLRLGAHREAMAYLFGKEAPRDPETTAVDFLIATEDPEVDNHLQEYLEAPRVFIRAAAGRALLRHSPLRWLPTVSPLLEDPEPYVRQQILFGLARALPDLPESAAKSAALRRIQIIRDSGREPLCSVAKWVLMKPGDEGFTGLTVYLLDQESARIYQDVVPLLSFRLERKTWDRMTKSETLESPLESAGDIVSWLGARRLSFDGKRTAGPPAALWRNRVPSGTRLSPYDLFFGGDQGFVKNRAETVGLAEVCRKAPVVIEGDTLVHLYFNEAREYWRKRLKAMEEGR